jgi:hypothetical protein
LHVLGTPPALILSQDQTLSYKPGLGVRRLAGPSSVGPRLQTLRTFWFSRSIQFSKITVSFLPYEAKLNYTSMNEFVNTPIFAPPES